MAMCDDIYVNRAPNFSYIYVSVFIYTQVYVSNSSTRWMREPIAWENLMFFLHATCHSSHNARGNTYNTIHCEAYGHIFRRITKSVIWMQYPTNANAVLRKESERERERPLKWGFWPDFYIFLVRNAKFESLLLSPKNSQNSMLFRCSAKHQSQQSWGQGPAARPYEHWRRLNYTEIDVRHADIC